MGLWWQKDFMTLPDLMAPIKTIVISIGGQSAGKTFKRKFEQRAAIQGKLISLRDDSAFAESVRTGAVKYLDGCIRMILYQAADNRPGVERIIGKDLLKQIESYATT